MSSLKPLRLLLLVAALAAPAVADVLMPPSLKIEAGQADLKAPGDNQTWRKAKPGQVVDFGLVVSTDREFVGSINYADGTSLVLKPATMLQVLSDGLRLHRGAAWIKVTKRGKGFTCVTPSAIASVRGTRFSVEVPSYSRLFARRYVNTFFDKNHLQNGLRGNLLSASIGLSMLSGLIGEAPGGRVPAAVKVFEGKVMVVWPAHTGAIKQTWMLTEGQKVVTDAAERSRKVAMVQLDYDNWSLTPPSARSGQIGRPAKNLLPSSDDLPLLRGAGTSGSLKLLDEYGN